MVKLSRSKIDLFMECPRCFWLDVKKKIKRPAFPPYTINNAVDYLLKQEFDFHRERGTPHPVMVENKINAVPYSTPKIHEWRSNFRGVQHHHKPTDFLVFGAIDDVWINPKDELIVVDYKATGTNQHQVYDSYRRQMEIYQWLLRKNDFNVSPIGHFIFAKVNKGSGFGSGKAILPFDLIVESVEGDSSWVEDALKRAREAYDSEIPPPSSKTCEYCSYVSNATAP